MFNDEYCIDCTGDCCSGDEVTFLQDIWTGTLKRPIHAGQRRIFAKIIKESYGREKQQHTFTLVLDQDVVDGEKGVIKKAGDKMLVKGRNLYRHGTSRKRWAVESKRLDIIAEKHKRGSAARRERKALWC